MTVVNGPLDEAARKTVGECLQSTLTDLLDMSLVAKQVHWNVFGPRFRSVHLQLDDVVATARSYSDIIAERAAAIAVSPDGRAGTIARTSGIDTVTDGWVKDSEAVDIMTAALGSVIGRVRERIAATDEPDPVTQNILAELAAELEKHHWMFQAENVEKI
jgi:starvation-inducible DNA-binding protein